MKNRDFRALLEKKWGEGKYVCIGLDPVVGLLPEPLRFPLDTRHQVATPGTQFATFNSDIVKATMDIAFAYKANRSHYARHGPGGLVALQQTIEAIHIMAPDVPVILDAKYGGAIPLENEGYVQEAFGFLNADAVTVVPYTGRMALQPFLECSYKGIFVVCSTSGSGSSEFQASVDMCGDMVPGDYMPQYLYVAHRIANYWNTNGNCGVVVGANNIDALREVRERVFSMPLLSPGIGVQQRHVPLEKQVELAVSAGRYRARDPRMIFCSSRDIIFASNGADFADVARARTLLLNELVNKYL